MHDLVEPPDLASARTGLSSWSPARVAALVIVAGVVFSIASAAVAWSLNQANERDLLEVQTKQAAAVLGSQILTLREPIETALRVSQATGGDPAEFARVMAPVTGRDALFVSASLWDVSSSTPRRVAQVGAPAELEAGSAAAYDLLTRASTATTFLVTSPGGQLDRVAYAIGDPVEPRFVVYAERAIPPDKVVPVQRTAPFANLDFATYIGSEPSASGLATTNIPESELPLSGDTSTVRIPFGDTTLILVARAQRHLGGELGWMLPWILLAVGLALTFITAFAATGLVRSRRRAESDRRTIEDLYDRLDVLYGEQRGIAETLQHALLPAFNPHVPGLDIASRYVAGAEDVDIGGDWYSVIRRGDREVCFVVGDVSGRGIGAAAIMARLRFTIRAYLAEGHDPGTVLSMCSRQFDIVEDGHFATVIVGCVDVEARCLTLASAGHFAPLVLAASGADYAAIAPGPPLGVGVTAYDETTVMLPAEATLVAFTDGLIERRGESLDVGLERLATAAAVRLSSAEALLDHIVRELTDERSEDDTALLALRWEPT